MASKNFTSDPKYLSQFSVGHLVLKLLWRHQEHQQNDKARKKLKGIADITEVVTSSTFKYAFDPRAIFEIETDYERPIEHDQWVDIDRFSSEVISEHIKGRIGIDMKDKLKYPFKDNRHDLHEISSIADDSIAQNARAVAAVTLKTFINTSAYNKSIWHDQVPNLKEAVTKQAIDGTAIELCSYIKFQERLTPAIGTAFLVTPQVLLTAAHVLKRNQDNDIKAEELSIVFDTVEKDYEGLVQRTILEDSIYSVEQVLYPPQEYGDCALIILDRPVSGNRQPLKLSTTDIRPHEYNKEKALYMLGHAMGMSMKYAPEGVVTQATDDKTFTLQIDSFSGNSGSPVFNAITHEVEGMLLEGEIDWEETWEEEKVCLTMNTYQVNDGLLADATKGEECLRAKVFKPLINQFKP